MSKKMDMFVEKLDRISDLPKPMILEILSRLPLEDAARVSTLSKAWRGFCSLNPILCLDHNFFALKSLVCNDNNNNNVVEVDADIRQIRDSFMDVVDYYLARAKQLQSPFRKLGLCVALDDDPRYFSRLDTWLQLVTHIHHIEDLCFSVQDFHLWDDRINDGHICWYEFPLSSLLVGSLSQVLRSLYVGGCKLIIRDSINRHSIFSSLHRLYLSRVFMGDSVFENLISCCQGIEVLVLENCIVEMQFLDLSNFPNLKTALFDNLYGSLWNLYTENSNLQFLKCEADETECHLMPAVCAGIRELVLRCTVNQPNLFHDLTSTFPLVEELEVEIDGTRVFKTANKLLRKLSFYSYGTVQVKELHIDCQNLSFLNFRLTV